MREALQRLGHRVTVLDMRSVQRPDGRIEDLPREPRLQARLRGWMQRVDPVFDIGNNRGKLARTVQALHRSDPFDVFEMEESFGFAGGLRLPVPVVIRLHGPHFLGKDATEPQGLLRWSNKRTALEGDAIRSAEAISSPSDSLLAATLNFYGAEPRRAVTITNPMPAGPDDGRWSVDRCDPNQILCVGRFDLRKGADIAIEAFVRVAATNRRLKLVLVGPDTGIRQTDGRLIHFPEYLTRQVPAEFRGRISFRGALSPFEIAALRLESVLCLTCSRFETYSYSVAEAMAAGVPVITSDGFGELIEDNKTGFVVPIGDVAATAAAIERALSDRGRLAALGHAAYRRCAEWLDPERVAAETVDFYRAVIDARSA